MRHDACGRLTSLAGRLVAVGGLVGASGLLACARGPGGAPGQAGLGAAVLGSENLLLEDLRPSGPHRPFTPYPYATPLAPVVGPGEAAGVVLDRGDPVAGVEISLIGPKDVTVSTDASGVWRAGHLPDGDYWLHYYNDSNRERIGYWQTPSRHVDGLAGAVFPAFDVHLRGFTDDPPNGSSVDLPYDFHWRPYALAIAYRFRVHDKPGPGGKPMFIGPQIRASSDPSYDYDGQALLGGQLRGGHYLWGVWWNAGQAGEGGNLYQEAYLYPPGANPTPAPEQPTEPPASQPLPPDPYGQAWWLQPYR